MSLAKINVPVASNKIVPVPLSANFSGNLVYNTTGVITIQNPGGGALTATSSNTNVVTIQSTTPTSVTIKCVQYSSSPVTITITAAETMHYLTNTITYNISTAKANGNVTLSATSGTVTYGTPGSFTITNNTSGGSLSVSSSDSTYVSASLSGTTVTVTVNTVNSATRTITVTSAATANYNAATATYTVTSAKANGGVTLSATSGTVTYGTPVNITVTKNTSGGALSVSSSSSAYVSASLSGTTVTITTNQYSSSAVTITVTSAATTNYNAATTTYTVTTARITGTLSINKSSMSLTVSAPSDTTTVTTNSNGTITATSADTSVCSATVSGTMVTIKGKNAGNTTVTIAVAQTGQYTAPTSKTVSVSVPTAIPTDMLDGTTLAQIKTIFSSGQGANYFKAGDYFDITFPTTVSMNQVSTTIAANSTWRVVCFGINHNSSKEGTKRGHFGIGKNTNGKDICFLGYAMNASITNIGGWNSCEMKTWLNGTFYNALPNDLRNVITSCTKYTDNTAGNSNVSSSNVTSTSQKIWLLAEFEVFGTRTYANQYEQNSQIQYDYYKNGNSKVRYNHTYQSSTKSWWLRSPCINDSTTFCYVNENAQIDINGSGNAYGIVPCFTIS